MYIQQNIKNYAHLPTNVFKEYNERHFNKCRNTGTNIVLHLVLSR